MHPGFGALARETNAYRREKERMSMEVGRHDWNHRRPPPKLAETGRSATLYDRKDARGGIVISVGGNDDDSDPEVLHSRSDTSAIAAYSAAPRYHQSPQLQRRIQRQLEQHSQPAPGPGFPHAHSAENLLGMTHSAGEWSSSDEGETVLECVICFQRFEEESSKTPRNLQCGHAYCTGKNCL